MRVIVADDHAEVRSALKLVLEQEPEVVVVGEATDGKGLLAQAESIQPDLVLLDWELPGRSAVHLVRDLRRLNPLVRVIALSGRPEVSRAALAAGANAFVSKGDPPERLLAALEGDD